jgi:hypothetical protein
MIQVRDNDDAAATAWPGGAHIAIWPNTNGLGILRFVKSGISNWNFVDRSTVNSTSGRILAINDANGTGDYMTILGSGNVGIGTTGPLSRLDVSGNVAVGTYAGAVAAPANGMSVSGNVCIGTSSSGTFPSPGKVTIQTSSAAGCLDGLNVNNGAGGGHIFLLPGTVNVQSYNNMTKQNDNAIIYSAGGSLTIAPWTGGPSGIRIEGNSGLVGIGMSYLSTYTYKLEVAGTTQCSGNSWTSDIRKKKNIQPLQLNGIDIIRKLNPVTYEWKEVLDPGMQGTQMGFIAQEIERIVPTMVLTKNDSLGSKGVKYMEMIPILVKAIQEQQKIIDNQKSDLETLKAENQQIKAAVAVLLKQNNLTADGLTGSIK